MAKKLQLVHAAAHPTPPRRLGTHGLALWVSIHSEYAIDDAGGIEILMQACSAIDRAEACAAAIDQDGEVLRVKGGMREHPLMKAELSNRAFTVRTLQKLGLSFEAVKPVGRPTGKGWSG